MGTSGGDLGDAAVFRQGANGCWPWDVDADQDQAEWPLWQDILPLCLIKIQPLCAESQRVLALESRMRAGGAVYFSGTSGGDLGDAVDAEVGIHQLDDRPVPVHPLCDQDGSFYTSWV